MTVLTESQARIRDEILALLRQHGADHRDSLLVLLDAVRAVVEAKLAETKEGE